VPVGRLVVLRAFPREEFLPVMSFIAIPSMIGPLMGPTLGGLLVEYVSWHWIFLINLPVGLAGVWASLRFMPQLKSLKPAAFDWGGFVLFSLGLMLLSLGLQGLGEQVLSTVVSVVMLFAGAASMAAYWLHAARSPKPLFDMALFAIPSYRIGILGNIFARLGSGATPFLTPMFLQLGLGYSPSVAGLSMIPAVLGAMFTKTLGTRLIRRIGYRRVLVSNTVLLGLMIASFALIDRQTTHLWLALHLGLFGMVNSMQFTAMNALTLVDLDERTASSGNSLLSVVMQLSMRLGVATSGLFLLLFSGATVSHATPGPALVTAFHATYLAIGGMAAMACFIFYQLRHHEGGARVNIAANSRFGEE